MDIKEAQKIASRENLDLVEVSPKADPPVCRVMDFGKFKYDQEKKEKKSKKRQRVSQLKEIRLRPNIENHDYQFKLRHLKKFIKEKNKVRVRVIFRGRENIYKQIGEQILQRVMEDLSDIASPQGVAKPEGKSIIVTLVPK